MTLLAPALVAGIGVLSLFAAWKRWAANTMPFKLVGLGLLGASGWLFARAYGGEFGGVYFPLCVALLAWLLVCWQADPPTAKRKTPRRRDRFPRPSAPALSRQLARFVMVVPMTGAAIIPAAVWSSRWLPWQTADRLALVMVLAPALWGVAMFWALADSKPMRPAAAMLSIGVVAGAALFA